LIKYPKIYLALDNCFASKRWTKPSDWIAMVKNLGVYYIEASADNEIDPLYMDKSNLNDWSKSVKNEADSAGIHISNFYSGHGTYMTTGLSHTDIRVRDRMQNDWIKPMMDMATKFDAGMGFYCHAFDSSVLQNPDLYQEYVLDLYNRLAVLSEYWSSTNKNHLSIEQMYTPHQIPWTINGSIDLIREVNKLSNSPIYITIDTGHQSGQHKFYKPSYEDIEATCLGNLNVWVGSDKCRDIIGKAKNKSINVSVAINEIMDLLEKYSYLFASPQDHDTYKWLSELGGYSPIIHLQQTTGKSSSHLCFDNQSNKDGIIEGKKVLMAIVECYKDSNITGMPTMCNEIHLTLEPFFGTADYTSDIYDKLKESIEYWRKFIPKDGLRLDKLLNFN